MRQILHGCAKTTAATRRAIQNSQESIKTLAERYSINPKTVMKWKHRASVKDLSMGPREPSSTVRRYHYESHAHLQKHLDAFVNAYNFAKRLKTLRGLTPYECLIKNWREHPELFYTEPYQLTLGLYILRRGVFCVSKENVAHQSAVFFFHTLDTTAKSGQIF